MPVIPSFLERVNPWRKQAEPPPPPITIRAAMLLLALYALTYFLPFYLSRATRPSPTLPRNAPSVIRARIRFVIVSCSVCTAVTYVVLVREAKTTPADALHLLGYWPLGLLDAFRSLLLTALLFLGPLFSYMIVNSGWREWVRLEPLKEVWNDWTTWRNLVAGPVTEEVLFRSASVPLMLLARASAAQTVLLSPLIFGLSHAHHFYEFRLTHPRVPVAGALLRTALQLAYTTLFGAYATLVYVRSGSLLAVCAVHAFCNAMGLPQLWGRVRPPPAAARIGPVMAVEGTDPAKATAEGAEEAEEAAGEGGGAGWTVAYYTLLVAGAALWWRNLWALTESDSALMPASAFSRS